MIYSDSDSTGVLRSHKYLLWELHMIHNWSTGTHYTNLEYGYTRYTSGVRVYMIQIWRTTAGVMWGPLGDLTWNDPIMCYL